MHVRANEERERGEEGEVVGHLRNRQKGPRPTPPVEGGYTYTTSVSHGIQDLVIGSTEGMEALLLVGHFRHRQKGPRSTPPVCVDGG
jgi:hypothetical protein